MSLKYSAPTSASDVLTTELNSLASTSTSTLSGAISNDQTGEFYTVADFEIYLNTQGSNRAAGASVSLFIFPTIDGTNYPDTANECLDNYYAGSIAVDDAALTARRLIIQGVRLPATDFKVAVQNNTGQAFASSANTVKIIRYGYLDA